MLTEDQARNAIGQSAISDDGEKLGKIGQLFLDDETEQPAFITVNTGLFGTKETFVPIGSATLSGDEVRVPFSKDKVKDAPNVDISNGHMDRDAERRLYDYYGMAYTKDVPQHLAGNGSDNDSSATAAGDINEFESAGYDTSGPTTDDAMTRSEERVDVGKTTEEAGRVRLRKYVTTEQETHTVPVRTERAVLEREPVTDANVGSATSGPDISEEEHEVVLSQERVTVDKTVEPVERVRIGTETVTQDETVTEDVRKEHIEVDGDVHGDRS
jgi:uncharacterized protein (TIGR02271 family)